MSESNTVATAEFALNLLRKEKAQKPKTTIATSPQSVATAFGMLLNGARTKSLDQMFTALSLGTSDLAVSNKGFLAQRKRLKRADLGVRLGIANAIYARLGVKFDEGFLARNVEFFEALVEVLDFSLESSVDTMNKFVNDNTKADPGDEFGMVRKLVPKPLPSNTAMLLLNALGFKGEWTVKFLKELTKLEDYVTGAGEKVKRQLMYRKGHMVYRQDFENEVYEAIVLPFGSSMECREVIVQARSGNTIEDVLAVLNADLLLELCGVEAKTRQQGELWLPRMKLDYENSLVATLKALGMVDIFAGATADLTGLYNGPSKAYVSDVLHKVAFELDEEGASGGAGTAIRVGIESAIQPFAMRVDKDFLSFTATKDGDILFAKYVNDPLPE